MRPTCAAASTVPTCCVRASRWPISTASWSAPAVARHDPALTLASADTVAIAEYIHSVHATMSGQGSPPGRNPVGIELNVLVGDAKFGEIYFERACSKCHSVTGDLKGIGAKFPDARALAERLGLRFQQCLRRGGGGGGRGGGAGAGNPVTVTLADGSKLEGTLVRKDDFIVILTLPDGTRKSIARSNGVPRVDVKDPKEPHKTDGARARRSGEQEHARRDGVPGDGQVEGAKA